MKYYLGIDGGGTKTTAVVGDENGKCLFRAEGKSINFYSVGMERARSNLKELITEIKNALAIEQFCGAFIGCSALDGKADDATISSLCSNIISAEKIGMNSDVYVALRATDGNCVAICGTGSMAIGEDTNGNICVTGGWGHILGDEGSAYAIALSALKKCCILDDKKDSAPLLAEAKAHFNTNSFRDIIDIIYSPDTTKDYIASFAYRVGDLAEKGDFSAMAIIKNEALAFCETVKSLIAQLDAPAHLSLYGGVFKNNPLFTEVFCTELSKVFEEIKIDTLRTPAEEGALKAAMTL